MILTIKCDPLPGGGKGVVIASTRKEAIDAINMFFDMLNQELKNARNGTANNIFGR